MGCDIVLEYDTIEELYVSIHAPRVGCDSVFISMTAWKFSFQFTHPVWGATMLNINPRGSSGVSIHAPRVGCD